MKGAIPKTAERFRRYQRDLKAYRQRSLFRRAHRRFRRDLGVLPHLFLSSGVTFATPLLQPRDRMIEQLRGRAVWTLDTAARLVSDIGLLIQRDLTGYISHEAFRSLDKDLVDEFAPAALSLDPVVSRPLMLVMHLVTAPPAFFPLPSGDRVVTWDFLMRDLQGTLGWRPDLLTRLEDGYLRTERAIAVQGDES